MIMVPRKARPRRSKNRVQLVNIDGTPARKARKPEALSWGPETDNWRWVPTRDEPVGTDSMGSDVYASDARYEPTAEDLAWLAAAEAREAADKARVLAEYPPLPGDMEEYRAYCDALDSGAIHPAEAGRFEFSPLHAIRSGQVTDDELAQLASYGCI